MFEGCTPEPVPATERRCKPYTPSLPQQEPPGRSGSPCKNVPGLLFGSLLQKSHNPVVVKHTFAHDAKDTLASESEFLTGSTFPKA